MKSKLPRLAYIHAGNRQVRLHRIYGISGLIALMLLTSTAGHSAAVDSRVVLNDAIASVDRKHQLFSASFQIFLLSQPQWSPEKYEEIPPLLSAVKKHLDDHQSILAANALFNNIATLKKNYYDENIFYFIQILLERNDTKTAHALFDFIKNKREKTLTSNITYLLASHSFERNEWQKTVQLLNKSMNNLAGESYHHALLMKGISFQKLKKHRESIEYYGRVAPTSKYYLSAQLNRAIANIRQGWWTDAHTIIQSTLESAEIFKSEEALNRLYLTLAYSLMNQKYYRESRHYFSHIGIDSVFANRALLGMTLTAASQNDFVSALSTVHILKNKQTYELSVDESYLLAPYFYEKLQQTTTAAAGYQEAINYYQKRISEIQKIIDSEINLEEHTLSINVTTTLTIKGNTINLSYRYPDYFFENYLKLKSYAEQFKISKNKDIQSEYEQLHDQYEAIIVKIIRNELETRVEQLDSYMNQSRFGLANLYDIRRVID